MEAPEFNPASLASAIAHGALDGLGAIADLDASCLRMHGVPFSHLLPPLPRLCTGEGVFSYVLDKAQSVLSSQGAARGPVQRLPSNWSEATILAQRSEEERRKREEKQKKQDKSKASVQIDPSAPPPGILVGPLQEQGVFWLYMEVCARGAAMHPSPGAPTTPYSAAGPMHRPLQVRGGSFCSHVRTQPPTRPLLPSLSDPLFLPAGLLPRPHPG
jgi:hypothetical protein